MERAVEWFIAITSLIIGLSHVLRPGDWAEAFRRLHAIGRSGAFINGGLSLGPGVLILVAHPTWTWPGIILTAFGCVLMLKGFVCFIFPDKALISMARGGTSPRSFVYAGMVALAMSAFAWYCLYVDSATVGSSRF